MEPEKLQQHRSYGNAPYLSIDDVFDEYKGEYQGKEPDWGTWVGEENVSDAAEDGDPVLPIKQKQVTRII